MRVGVGVRGCGWVGVRVHACLCVRMCACQLMAAGQIANAIQDVC